MIYGIEVSHSHRRQIRYNLRRSDGKLFERQYLWHEAVEVLDWMEGCDRSLPNMNMATPIWGKY